MFSINEFRSSIERKGVLQNNRFVVQFEIPPYLRQLYGDEENRLLSLRCESANLPGVQLSLLERPRIGFGPLEYNPYNVINDDLTLNFLVDAHGTISKLFYDWINTIVNFQGSRGQSELNKSVMAGDHQLGAFEVGYKDSYKTTIEVTLYDRDARQLTTSVQLGDNEATVERRQTLDIGTRVMKLTAYNAYPKQLPTTDMSWQNENELMRMAIPFTFTDYKIEYFRNENSFEATVNNPEANLTFQSVKPKKVIEPNIPEGPDPDDAIVKELIDNANRTISDPNASSFERASARDVRRAVATPLAGSKI